MNKVTIVVPVYSDWPSLNDCIESLKLYVATEHDVMFVNDCGPDADTIERNIKKSIVGNANFKYFRNKKNLGFVKNCNNAVFNLDKTDNDILFLNSDTIVTEGFLEELIGVLHSNSKLGAVSPRSNNASIATTPISSISQRGIEAEDSYRYFKKYHHKMLNRYSIAPVAHGFCMLVRRKLIKKYGLFDEVFGIGYGEEVDFCMRIKSHGYESALCNWAYVFHLEARSFGLDKKAKLIEQSSKIIIDRYPTYKLQVKSYLDAAYIAEEPNVLRRLKLRLKSLIKNSLKTP